MDLERFFTPAWWLSSVLGAILLSLFSAYLKDWLSVFLALAFRTWRSRSKAAKERYKAEIEAIAADPAFREAVERSEMRQRAQSISFLIMAAIALATAAFFILINNYVRDHGGPEVPKLAMRYALVCFMALAASSIIFAARCHSLAALSLRRLLDAEREQHKMTNED